MTTDLIMRVTERTTTTTRLHGSRDRRLLSRGASGSAPVAHTRVDLGVGGCQNSIKQVNTKCCLQSVTLTNSE